MLKSGPLDEACPNNTCPASYADDVKSYDAFATTSTVTFIAGGASAGLGLLLLGTAPSKTPTKTSADSASLRLQPVLGPATLGLRGSF